MYIKKLFLFLTIFTIVILSSCSKKEDPRPVLNVTAESNQGELENVYDDGYSTVYLAVNNDNWLDAHTKAVELMILKRKWETFYPKKRIVTMSIVTGGTGGYGRTYVAGLLIHYEIVPDK